MSMYMCMSVIGSNYIVAGEVGLVASQTGSLVSVEGVADFHARDAMDEGDGRDAHSAPDACHPVLYCEGITRCIGPEMFFC